LLLLGVEGVAVGASLLLPPVATTGVSGVERSASRELVLTCVAGAPADRFRDADVCESALALTADLLLVDVAAVVVVATTVVVVVVLVVGGAEDVVTEMDDDVVLVGSVVVLGVDFVEGGRIFGFTARFVGAPDDRTVVRIASVLTLVTLVGALLAVVVVAARREISGIEEAVGPVPGPSEDAAGPAATTFDRPVGALES
jgi:hypothetical protein